MDLITPRGEVPAAETAAAEAEADPPVDGGAAAALPPAAEDSAAVDPAGEVSKAKILPGVGGTCLHQQNFVNIRLNFHKIFTKL